METIHILHTNDIHTHLTYWPRTAHFLKSQKYAWNQLEKTTAYNFELGDAVDRVHPLAEASHGQAIIKLLNQADYDAATIGNNEGVGETKKDLDALYDEANFLVTLGNLYEVNSQQLPDWADEYLIFSTDEGTKIGVFGLTYPFQKTYEPLGWDVREPLEIIKQVIQKIAQNVDVIILLSHLGIYYDRKIAEKFPVIDLIIGAHTHHVLEKGEQVNKSLLTGGGKYNEYIGHTYLSLDNHQLVSKETELIHTDQLDKVSGEASLAASYQKAGETALAHNKIANLPEKLETDWHGESKLADFVMEAMSQATGQNQVLLNAGLLVKSLEKGVLTAANLHNALPHSMRLVNITLPANQMQNFFLELEKNRDALQHRKIMGTGFRGKIFGDILYRNISVDLDAFTVYFNGEKLVKDNNYCFTTVDFFAFSPMFSELAKTAKIKFLFPDLLRDVVGQYAKEKYPIKKEV